MKLPVLSFQNWQSTSDIDVNEDIFNCPFNEGLVHQVVVSYQAAGRMGTVAQKSRAQVSGGGKKPWRQKGTGRARAGTTRGPIWRGGGVTFARDQRDYEKKVNKKVYRKAIFCMLSELNRQGRLIIVDEIDMPSAKTKDFVKHMSQQFDNTALLLDSDPTDAMFLSSRNRNDYEVMDVLGMNLPVLLNFEKVVVSQAAVKKIEEMYS